MKSMLLLFAAAGSAGAGSIAYCPDTGDQAFVASGGVVAYITVNINPTTGGSMVLPVGVKMFDEATNSTAWKTTRQFGPLVTVLPRLNIDCSKGYMYYGPDGPIVYSREYPILIHSTTNGCPANTEYQLTLFGMTTETMMCSEYPGYFGAVRGDLCSAAGDILLQRAGTNGICHYGLDRSNQVAQAKSAVVVLYFNLALTNDCCMADDNFTNNWPNYPFTCASRSAASNTYWLSCFGSKLCQ
jgi:hypothetical protein